LPIPNNGGFIALRGILRPNDLSGRVSFLFFGLVIAGIGYALYRNGKKGKERSIET
jgi:hypothetical protein